MKLQKPKGTQDILPADSAKWQYVENVARETFKKYNYGEIRTPMFEHYEVISRSVGDTTDIVTKEMYDFHDKGDRHITLRPEGTAPVVRSYVENKLCAPEVQKPVKVYYIGSMFRYERPQAGRLREFHQLGVECFGSKNPATDVETIAMAYQLFNTLGIKDVTLHLNSLGNTESRLAYRQALIDYLTPMRESLSKDSQRRLDENPLRVLDSKEKEDKVAVENAPSILDYLDEESQAHFDEVRTMLDSLNIPYVIDTNMVRGIDYYNHTIFEFITTIDKSELTICAGGRYDGLVGQLKGKADQSVPAVGFAMGMERLLLLLEQVEQAQEVRDCEVFLLAEPAFQAKALVLAEQIRDQLEAANSTIRLKTGSQGSMKSQMKKADQSGAIYAVILGEREWESQQLLVKELATGEQAQVALTELTSFFIEKFKQ